MASSAQVTIIRPSRGWVAIDLRELWAYRELLYFFVWRDLKVRYKRTVIGAGWAIIQPFLTMVVFSVFFGRLAHVPSDGVPYPVFAYAALVPWMYFANALIGATNAVVEHGHMVRKVYFPRLILPTVPVASGLVDAAIALIVLAAMMLYYGVPARREALVLPIYLGLAVITALAAGLWLAALNVRYRDVRYAVPFLTQLWLFATPVAYPSSLVPPQLRSLYGLNPMVGVIEGFRWALLGAGEAPGALAGASAVATILLLGGGLAYFRRVERSFADVV